MGSTRTESSRRPRNSKGQALLDERRLKDIRRKIAEGFYNRNEVRRSIADRLASRLADEAEVEEDT